MKIALLGYGVEGVSAYNYLRGEYPSARFEIYDSAVEPKRPLPDGVAFHGGRQDFHDIEADLVIRTPAIAPDAISTRGEVSSVTKEFFKRCPLPIIGVTGTKGKGTTASLTAAMLKNAGFSTWLVGNIGLPALDVMTEVRDCARAGRQGVVVYELSSFQLWDMTRSPHVAVVLMVEPEHLDVHKDARDYFEAKANITRYQSADDAAIYYADNETAAAIGNRSPGKKIAYSLLEGDELTAGGAVVARRSDIALYGEHNVGNVQAAILAAWQFTQDKAAITAAIRQFKGLEHRIEPVRAVDGLLFINDSFSTAPAATLAAVKSFAAPKLLIMGGYDRGADYGELAEAIVGQPRLKKVFLIGQTKTKMAAAFTKAGYGEAVICGDLATAVRQAKAGAAPGDVVVFSPGAASFDMFKDFSDRGEKYKTLVNNL